MLSGRTSLAFGLIALGFFPAALRGAGDDYRRAVLALNPDHYYPLDDTELGEPMLDDNGDPIIAPGGFLYEGVAEDIGKSPDLILGHFEGKFEPVSIDPPFGALGIPGPFGLCGLDETNNLAFSANNAASINLGPGDQFANDTMTVAMWFTAAGSEGGDRIWTNNRPDKSDHFQITLGAGASLVIGINPEGSGLDDSLQVPESAIRVKDSQWHHIVASRNGPTMANVFVVIDGVDYTGALADSTTGWGRTGDDAHIASRPGGDGGVQEPMHMTLNGNVDETAIWLGRQLTIGESQDLYFAAVGCIPRATVTRKLTKTSYLGGESVPVGLEITAEANNVLVSVKEALPPGAVAANISHGGVQVDQTIEWTDLSNVMSDTLTYSITPAPCGADLKFGSATYSADGSPGRVLGDDLVTRAQADQNLGQWVNLDLNATGGFTETLGDHDIFVSSKGAGIKGASDSFRFVHVPVQGDFQISARIDCLSDEGEVGQVGVMVRDTTDAFSAHAAILASLAGPGASLRGIYRRETNAATPRSSSPIVFSDRDVPALPVYVRIRRVGEQLFFERSPDGTNYTELANRPIGTATGQVGLKDAALVGLAVAGNGSPSAQGVFSAVSGPTFRPVTEKGFRRGDTDSDGAIDISDAVRILGFLFLGDADPPCKDAADTDDNGEVDITDAVNNLGYQFLGTAAPAAPGPLTCGPDPTPETLELGCVLTCP